MRLVIGLGNIGKEYARTRHNVGFMCLDSFSQKHDLSFKKKRVFSYVQYHDCILIKPSTYMNLSGEAYKSALSTFGKFEEVLVVTDDMELRTGDIRIRTKGGSGGHNGLKSVLQAYGTDAFVRVRIGIGRSQTVDPREHVLDAFTKQEIEVISKLLETITNWLEVYIQSGVNSLLDAFSIWKKQPIPSQQMES